MKTRPDNPRRLTLAGRVHDRALRVVRRSALMPSDAAYNLTISDSHRFVWFRVAKVGTRTILRHLSEAGVTLDVEHAMQVHYPLEPYRDYFAFAFVRNPWDRLVSCYHNKVVDRGTARERGVVRWKRLPPDMPFDDFVEFVATTDLRNGDPHLRLQSCLVDLNRIDFLGRLETFDRDVALVLDRIGLPAGTAIQTVNRSQGRRSYREYYTDVTRDRVAALYDADIRVFGYEFAPRG